MNLKPNQEWLRKPLEQHYLWLDSNGRTGRQANFAVIGIEDKDFSNLDLHRVSFSVRDPDDREFYIAGFGNAGDKTRRDLRIDNLNFENSILTYADFYGGSLCDCNFRNANLDYAEMRSLVLWGSNFEGVNMRKVFKDSSTYL